VTRRSAPLLAVLLALSVLLAGCGGGSGTASGGYGAAALFIKRQVRLATEDVKANPTLCKAISAPLMQVRDSISGAVSQLRNGDVSGIEALNGVVGGIQGKASRNGVSIPDSTTATP